MAPIQHVTRQHMADRTIIRPTRVLQHVIVNVKAFIFLEDFVIIDCQVDFLGPRDRIENIPFHWHVFVKMERGLMEFLLKNVEVTFSTCRSMKKESDLKLILLVNNIVEEES